MFKSVTYVGLENQPELRRQAEVATQVLAEEVTRFQENLSVEWTLGENLPASLCVQLTLDLPTGSARAKQEILPEDLIDPDQLSYRLRRIWQSVLDRFIHGSFERMDQLSRQPVEVS